MLDNKLKRQEKLNKIRNHIGWSQIQDGAIMMLDIAMRVLDKLYDDNMLDKLMEDYNIK